MKSQFNLRLNERCESHSCSEGDHSNRCPKDGKLYAVWGIGIDYNDRHEYYLCEEGVSIDVNNGFTVEEITE